MRKISFLVLLLPLPAFAEFHFACGAGREKGAALSEIGFSDAGDSLLRLFLDGKEVPEEKLGAKAMAGGLWLASVDRGPGQGSRKFVFDQGKKSVQEFSVDEQGNESRSGAPRKCDFSQKLD